VYKAKWVGGHNGHWEIYNGNEFVISCDDSELTETIDKLSKGEN